MRSVVLSTVSEYGFNYIVKKFYVSNRGSTTYRDTAQEIKEIIDIIKPDNTITVDKIEALSIPYNVELIKNIYCTLTVNGAYVNSIQFNDYENYTLCIDCLEGKLYIKNTNLIYDLTLNESRESRILGLHTYYIDMLGLDTTIETMSAIYDFLISFYSPTVYNVLKRNSDDTYSYSSEFAISNYNNTSIAEYTCMCNPDNTYTNNVVAYIDKADTDTSLISLTSTIPSSISIGDTIIINNATTSETTYTYSADGEYVVSNLLNETNQIQVQGVLNGSYTYNYPKLSLVQDMLQIKSISRDNSTIELQTSVPNTLVVGDIITVTGTTITADTQTVSCDGEYVIGYIEGSIIGVQQQPLTNFTATSSSAAYVYKKYYLNTISLISNNTLTYTTEIPLLLQQGNKVELIKNNNTTIYTVQTATLSSCTIQETIEDFTPIFPTLSIQVPSTEIDIEVSSTKLESEFPVGTFRVDNFIQCQQYINTCPTLKVPTEDIYNNINKSLPKIIKISDTIEAELKGTL